MKFGTDLDGVLADFNTSYINLIKRKCSRILPAPSAEYPDVWDYDYAAGVTKEERKLLFAHISENPQFLASQLPLPEAIDALQLLSVASQCGHSIYFITDRPGDYAKEFTEWWLQQHGMRIPTVLISGNKAPIVKALKLDVYVDDKPETVSDVVATCPETRVYVINQPYNQTDLPGSIRVASAFEVVKREFKHLWNNEGRKAA